MKLNFELIFSRIELMKRSELFFSFILLPVDIAMIIASFVLAYYIRVDLEVGSVFSDINIYEYLNYAFWLMPIWVAIYALSGMYNAKVKRGLLNQFSRVFMLNSVASLFLVLAIFFTKGTFFSRLILLLTWILSIILIYSGRLIVKLLQIYLLKFNIGLRKVLIVGSNEIADFVVSEISKNQSMGLKVAGIINGRKNDLSTLKKLGNYADFKKIVEKFSIDEVIMTESRVSKKVFLEILESCYDKRLSFKFVPEIFSFSTLNVVSESIGSMPVFQIRTAALEGWGRIIKRIIDFVFSVLLLIICALLFILVAIIQKSTSRGSVFYCHERVGRDGKTFKLYKFRSMYFKAEDKINRYWTTKNDQRVTPFGKLLRKTNIDELPQFYNILKGDMSIVGPRPEQPKFVKKFAREIPGYFKRHRVKSGLTGWAQVNGLKGDTSINERVRYDMYYIENWSLWFDFKIILKTIWMIIYEFFGGKYEYRSNS